MSGAVIGKELNFGYPGNVSRSIDAIITNRPSKGDIPFGTPVVLNGDNTVSSFNESNTSEDFVGIAIREVKQAINYNTSASGYLDKERTDVIVRGSVCIEVNNGTSAAGGKVYIRIKENPALPKGFVGGFEAEPDGLNTVELKGVRFTSGRVDANKVAEITILDRKM